MGIRTVFKAELLIPYVVSSLRSWARSSSTFFAAAWTLSGTGAGAGGFFENKVVK
jgi:hypothetical protein